MGPERQVSVGCIVAGVMWSLTVLLILAGTITAMVADQHSGFAVAIGLMAHGLACSAAAATVTIRNMLRRQSKLLRDAFQLGKEAGSGGRATTGGSTVRPIHS